MTSSDDTNKPLTEEYRERQINDDDIAEKTKQSRQTSLNHVEYFLNLNEAKAREQGINPELIPNSGKLAEFDYKDVERFMKYLKQRGVSEGVANSEHLGHLKKMFSIGEVTHGLEKTPVEDAREINDYGSAGESEYPPIEISEVADALREMVDAQRRAIWILGLKTGARRAEIYNLDLQDLHIGYPPLKNHEEYVDITPRKEIESDPDTLYITSEISNGEAYRGEKRVEGNKRKNSVKFPIGGELKHALVRWLAARPRTPNSPANPLFVTIKNDSYIRMSAHTINERVRTVATEKGWNDYEESDDITSRWFRHYFTSHHRSAKTGMGVLHTSYFRGDQKPSGIDTSQGSISADPYTEMTWPENSEVYLNNIYKFGLPTL